MFNNQPKVMQMMSDRAFWRKRLFAFSPKLVLFHATSSCSDGVGTVTVRRLS